MFSHVPGLQRINEYQPISGAWTPSFYGYDGMGSVRFLAGPTGTVTHTYDYDAWGSIYTTSGSTPNNHLYSGEQYDPGLHLRYLRARYSDTTTGRSLTRSCTSSVREGGQPSK